MERRDLRTDAVSGDVGTFLATLEGYHAGFTQGVFVLGNIEIDKRYRNRNYGQQFMEIMMEDLFFLEALPVHLANRTLFEIVSGLCPTQAEL